MNLTNIINDPSINLALIIGNGINRYNNVNQNENNSWDAMLFKLWQRHSSKDIPSICSDGISLIEFYDALDLTKNQKIRIFKKNFVI